MSSKKRKWFFSCTCTYFGQTEDPAVRHAKNLRHVMKVARIENPFEPIATFWFEGSSGEMNWTGEPWFREGEEGDVEVPEETVQS